MTAIFKVLYKREVQMQVGLDGKKHPVTLPAGNGHIFKMVHNKKTGKVELADRSLCEKGQYDLVGKDAVMRDSALGHLPMCPECATAWRLDPASPWAKFVRV